MLLEAQPRQEPRPEPWRPLRLPPGPPGLRDLEPLAVLALRLQSRVRPLAERRARRSGSGRRGEP
eukprot:2849944-Alexandrium_andersonii.AAC.1